MKIVTICLCFLGGPVLSSAAGERIRVLIVTGQNNHAWAESTPIIREILEDTGRFHVVVSTTPPEDSTGEAWAAWQPNFKAAQVVLSDYNGQMWPDDIKTRFVEFVQDGGGVVIIHAANNAFTGWKEYEAMCGLLWRGADYGDRIYFDDDLNKVRVPAKEGAGAGHGHGHAYQIATRDENHPIFKDLPKVWMHAPDELYHGQRGPAENMNILATAYSSEESNGTGVHEPMVWWIPYGNGKVISLMPGHLGENQPRPNAFDCVGFRTLIQRSTEWVGTGGVTIPVPENFPTEDTVSTVSQ